MVPMWLIQFGEVVFGGVGSGLYGMLIYAILAVFISGSHDRSHPGIPGQEDRVLRHEDDGAGDSHHAVSGAELPPPSRSITGRRYCRLSRTRAPTASRRFSTPISSAANNNGSAFAGLSVNTPFYNIMPGRSPCGSGAFGVIVPVLAIAGSLAAKKRIDVSSRNACRLTVRCSSSC